MPAMPPKTNPKIRDQMLEAWRQARFGEIILDCKTASEATNLRFSLYNVAKPYRQPGAVVDAALAEALETVSVSLSKAEPTRVVLRPKAMGWMSEAVGAALAYVGVNPDAVQSPEQLAADESLQRVLAKAEAAVAPAPASSQSPEPPAPGSAEHFGHQPSPPVGGTPLGKPNPFYSRDTSRPGSSS